jgi:hypothetical protein
LRMPFTFLPYFLVGRDYLSIMFFTVRTTVLIGAFTLYHTCHLLLLFPSLTTFLTSDRESTLYLNSPLCSFGKTLFGYLIFPVYDTFAFPQVAHRTVHHGGRKPGRVLVVIVIWVFSPVCGLVIIVHVLR